MGSRGASRRLLPWRRETEAALVVRVKAAPRADHHRRSNGSGKEAARVFSCSSARTRQAGGAAAEMTRLLRSAAGASMPAGSVRRAGVRPCGHPSAITQRPCLRLRSLVAARAPGVGDHHRAMSAPSTPTPPEGATSPPPQAVADVPVPEMADQAPTVAPVLVQPGSAGSAGGGANPLSQSTQLYYAIMDGKVRIDY